MTKPAAFCPLCGARIVPPSDAAVGDVLTCRGCGAYLVLNDLMPPVLDAALIEWVSSWVFFLRERKQPYP